MRKVKDTVDPLVLVVNVGSTSVKWKLFAKRGLDVRGQGEFDRPCDFAAATKSILRTIGNTARLSSIVHRIVHGGGKFAIERISHSLLKEIHAFDHLAPLHNPPALECAQYFIEYMPGVPQWAVFDSGFFVDLPEVAKQYAIPKELVDKYNVHRYGFHGISHEYALIEAAKKLKKPIKNLTLISVHLGGGDSVCLIDRGKPLDSSMGFTPLEGLPMMTRCGDIDPGLVLYLLRKHIEERGVSTSNLSSPTLDNRPAGRLPDPKTKNKKQKDLNSIAVSVGFLDSSLRGNDRDGVDWLEHILNEESGLKGISGENDFLELLHKRHTDTRAALALDLFVYRIRKYVGSYLAVSPRKPDAIVFTGQIGSGEPFVRDAVVKDLWVAKGVKMITVPADEELAMAKKITQNSKLKD